MKCFQFSNGVKKEEPQIIKSASVWSNSSTSTDHDTRRSGSEFNSQNITDTSTESVGRPQYPSFSQKASNLKAFTFAELRAATKNFSRSLMVGEGGFGCVYRGSIKNPDDPSKKLEIAVKQLSRKGLQGHKEWLTEVNVLGVVEHQNLVKLVGYCAEDDERGMQRLLIYEFMPNRSVGDHLSARSTAPLSWAMRLRIALDAARGLTYLHEGMDFQVVGTIGYAAPEYMQTGHLTVKSDIWSYGVVLYELITGRPPMDRNRPRGEQKLLEWVRPYISDLKKFRMIIDPRLDVGHAIKSATKLSTIANRCLVGRPKSRPKMSEVLEMVEKLVQSAEVGTPQPPLGIPAGQGENPEKKKKGGLDLKRRLGDLKMGEGRRLVWRGWTPKLVKTS